MLVEWLMLSTAFIILVTCILGGLEAICNYRSEEGGSRFIDLYESSNTDVGIQYSEEFVGIGEGLVRDQDSEEANLWVNDEVTYKIYTPRERKRTITSLP